MAELIYSAIASLDGYIEDDDGKFGWAQPDEEVHTFINELQSSVGTHLYGRRMYETLAVWDTDEMLEAQAAYIRDFARVWQAADKVVYSRTLDQPTTARTRIEREFDPEAIREMKETASSDIVVGGPELAGQALEAGIVDECQLFVTPVIVGGGKSWLPGGLRLGLELAGERRFAGGVVHLRYRTAR